MTTPLDAYDVLLADLDGTLYFGPVAVPGAVEAVRGAGERGVRTMYVTNNASRRPADVAEHLAELGFGAVEDEVVTSSQAAAALLAQQLPAGAKVLVVGTEALAGEVELVGLTPVRAAEGAVAVVQGHSPETGWKELAEACVALLAGAVWVACNMDATLPTERGPLPGNGSMVAVLRTATAREPQVAGKPGPALMDEAVRRSGAQRPLVVGDRLDTDIEGGRAVGMDTLHVLTGVSGAVELLAAPPHQRPDLVAADMAGLTAQLDSLRPGPRPGWAVRAVGGGVELAATDAPSGDATTGTPGPSGAGEAPDEVDALRALLAAHWAAGGGAVQVSAADPVAAAALDRLGVPVAGRAS